MGDRRPPCQGKGCGSGRTALLVTRPLAASSQLQHPSPNKSFQHGTALLADMDSFGLESLPHGSSLCRLLCFMGLG